MCKVCIIIYFIQIFKILVFKISFLHLVFFVVRRSHHVNFDPRSSTTRRLVDVDGGSGGRSSGFCLGFCFVRAGILHSFLFDDNFLYGNGRGGRNVPVRSRYLSVDPFFLGSEIKW